MAIAPGYIGTPAYGSKPGPVVMSAGNTHFAVSFSALSLVENIFCSALSGWQPSAWLGDNDHAGRALRKQHLSQVLNTRAQLFGPWICCIPG